MKDDMISRQAAIDTVKRLMGDYELSRTVQTGLYILPSAQPEIIKCKDCKYGSPNGKYGCKCYHYQLYETHEMKPEDFCSYAERRPDD